MLAGGRVVADDAAAILGEAELLTRYDLALPTGFDLALVTRRGRPGPEVPTHAGSRA